MLGSLTNSLPAACRSARVAWGGVQRDRFTKSTRGLSVWKKANSGETVRIGRFRVRMVDPEADTETMISEESARRRRGRPPLRYTEDFQTPDEVKLKVIGVVRSPYKERFGTPRQPNVTANTLGNKEQSASIVLHKGQKYDVGLRGLRSFEYCWVMSYFHLNQGWNPLVRPPRGPGKKQGVFATRSPHHPNPIGLSCLKITGVDEKGGIIHVQGVDLLDGTAVIDIKPCKCTFHRCNRIIAYLPLAVD